MRQFFITGTDTDCGKTYVTCQLLDYLNQSKLRALAIKPVASGCFEQNNTWMNEDVINLQRHSQFDKPINGWMFPTPISPHFAAKEQGIELSARDIAGFCKKPCYQERDYLFIEGAGGLIVPLNDRETWLDFLQSTVYPVIVVVGMRVGCINHALLTAAVLQSEKIRSLGWIANCLHHDMISMKESIETLKKRMPMPLLGTVPYKGTFIPFRMTNNPLFTGFYCCS
jgi:dethiobiotin synthetase